MASPCSLGVPPPGPRGFGAAKPGRWLTRPSPADPLQPRFPTAPERLAGTSTESPPPWSSARETSTGPREANPRGPGPSFRLPLRKSRRPSEESGPAAHGAGPVCHPVCYLLLSVWVPHARKMSTARTSPSSRHASGALSKGFVRKRLPPGSHLGAQTARRAEAQATADTQNIPVNRGGRAAWHTRRTDPVSHRGPTRNGHVCCTPAKYAAWGRVGPGAP